jgi:2-Cys peroxiredoxin 5
MSFRTSLRPLTRLATRPSTTLRASVPRRAFHPSPAAFISVGDVLPDLDVLQEGNPGNKVNLAHEVNINGDALIIGVPAAFSPSCSATHVPGYIQHPKTKDFPLVAVVSVNDVFV